MSDSCQWLHEVLENSTVMRFPFDRSSLPLNGIYFFYEDGEMWGHSDQKLRIVRIGTHKDGNFRTRMADHYLLNERMMNFDRNKPAPKDRSIFRKNLGRALLNREKDPYLTIWDIDFTTKLNRENVASLRDIDKEKLIEEKVTRLLREKFSFRFISLDVSIARLGSTGLEATLIGTRARCKLCRPSANWLGLDSPNPKIRQSGLWLVQHLKSPEISDHDKQIIETVLNVELANR
jgi:hypothetical protein